MSSTKWFNKVSMGIVWQIPHVSDRNWPWVLQHRHISWTQIPEDGARKWTVVNHVDFKFDTGVGKPKFIFPCDCVYSFYFHLILFHRFPVLICHRLYFHSLSRMYRNYLRLAEGCSTDHAISSWACQGDLGCWRLYQSCYAVSISGPGTNIWCSLTWYAPTFYPKTGCRSHVVNFSGSPCCCFLDLGSDLLAIWPGTCTSHCLLIEILTG